jgi:hypothetical protein
MNSGVEDALAVSWRLSAILKGYGGPLLLESYEAEQRPIMISRLERCSHHFLEHGPRYQLYAEKGPELMMSQSKEGENFRDVIKEQLDASGSECLDRGIELDSRYRSAVIYGAEKDEEEPAWELKRYTPSTYPGARAPHIFLKDQKTSILDTFGSEWTLVSFNSSIIYSNPFADIAEDMNMPLKTVVLEDEDQAHQIWGHNLVLIRADGHVAWRGQEMPGRELVKEVLEVVTGQKGWRGYVPATTSTKISEALPMLNHEYLDGGSVVVEERL